MKKILHSLRKSPFVNYPVRSILRGGKVFFDKLSAHWSTSGIIDISFDGVNLKVFNRCDDGFVQRFYYQKNYHESNLLAITDAFAKRSTTILDIGANTGIDALIIAKKNPGVKIIAIEPYEPNYTRLEKNIQLNEVTNIDLRKVALGETESELEFIVPADGRISDVASAVEGIGEKVYTELEWKKTKVHQSTLDNLNLPEIKFFKCDVEGYEVSVFKGGEKFFKQQQPTFIVEIVLNPESISYFNEFAKTNGYTIYFFTVDGLVKMDALYDFDWRGDFLFARYKHPQGFIPSKDFGAFVEATG
jgi:FkbM family methyltransferase